MEQYPPVYYSDYLELKQILGSQHPVSFKKAETAAHDEMLFVVIHQAYELWFKQVLFEVQSVIDILNQPAINDNGPELQTMVHRLQRVVTILEVLVHQMDIMETMTPMDFLDFRDMLRPASGFQSIQFKILEAKLGLHFEHRHGQQYYISQLRDEDVQIIREAEATPNLLQLVNAWLERMPVFKEQDLWASAYPKYDFSEHPFWKNYASLYAAGLGEGEKNNVQAFDQILMQPNDGSRSFSKEASRAALFIYAYRGYPMLELPFQFLNTLLQIDNQLGAWRSRHLNMVRRMIGTRTGTGGSTGAGYLQGAMDKHYIFRELAQLNSFLVERRRLPGLPKAVTEKLGYR